MSTPAPEIVTQLLQAAGAGDPRAAADLLPLVYDELRRLAAARLARTPPGQTLQPTALVHEAYLRLVGAADPGWENRGHFFFAAARAIQDILIENARRKAALKRGGGRKRVDLKNLQIAGEAPAEDLLLLKEALDELEKADPQAHRIVMLRFFAGLTEQQTAEVTGMAERTLSREWRYVRAQLRRRLAAFFEPDENADDSDHV